MEEARLAALETRQVVEEVRKYWDSAKQRMAAEKSGD
jgi:hypothetical protein